MDIQVIGSGSSGNSYRISDGSQSLLLDCGLSIKKIQIATNFQCSSLKGCLITHSHSDHCKAAKDLLKLGVDLFANKETFETLGLEGHHVHIIEDRQGFTLNNFYVLPLSVEHDVPTLSYLVNTQDERLLYVTDARFFPYQIDGITRLMVEANHDAEVIKHNVENGHMPESLAKRIVRTHMSIQSCLALIEKMDKSRLKEIWLLHLSENNSQADEFLQKVRAASGCVVHLA